MPFNPTLRLKYISRHQHPCLQIDVPALSCGMPTHCKTDCELIPSVGHCSMHFENTSSNGTIESFLSNNGVCEDLSLEERWLLA